MTAQKVSGTTAASVERRPSDVRVSDLSVAVSFPELRLDTDARETLGRYVKELTVSVFKSAECCDDNKPVLLGELKCFLFDAIGADKDGDTLWPEADYEGTACEFYEFLFSRLDFVRGRLLHRIAPKSYADIDEDDEEAGNWELCNVLCVSSGWWTCRPEVLAHVIKRVCRTIRFDFVCVDTKYIAPARYNTHRSTPSTKNPIELPAPFKKAVWGETRNPAELVESARDRFFWIAALFGDLDCDLTELPDETRAQLKALQ